ncbi:MAG TPA: PilX N-terminal domain-containing pilus assembly protein [Gammaproteobacteria bacterium]|nr:PilX N-terminal domain-containing pilus assembly protein [Gammaproteobacteria bacterium]
MMHSAHFPVGARRSRQGGLALVSALLMLIIITLLGVSLFLGVTLQQKAAGNSLQKTRALEVAQSAVTAAENWLNVASSRQVPLNCTSSVVDFRVCALPPAKPSEPNTWLNAGATKVSFTKLVNVSAGQVNSYASNPAVWITYLGRATMGPGNLFEIDAQASGGNVQTLAVIQTVYYVGGTMRNSTPAQNLGQ